MSALGPPAPRWRADRERDGSSGRVKTGDSSNVHVESAHLSKRTSVGAAGGFLPWRFSYAALGVRGAVRYRPASENLHRRRHPARTPLNRTTQGAPPISK